MAFLPIPVLILRVLQIVFGIVNFGLLIYGKLNLDKKMIT
jgi:hypothetical protein